MGDDVDTSYDPIPMSARTCAHSGDEQRSGLYRRFHLMVAHELEQKHVPLTRLLEAPPDVLEVQKDLQALPH